MSSENFITQDSQTPVKYAVVNTNATAVLIAAVTGKKIRVLSYLLQPISTVTVTLRNSVTTATLITGAMTYTTGANPIQAEFSPVGHFETIVSEGLSLLLGSGVQVSGHIAYQEIG
jgi:hypothetical protein